MDTLLASLWALIRDAVLRVVDRVVFAAVTWADIQLLVTTEHLDFTHKRG